MARTCPDGHLSHSEDYCDVCGLALTADSGSADGGSSSADPDATSPDLTAVPSASQDCPNCSAHNPPDALFCEACGYDFTTGAMPRPVEPLTFPIPASMADPSRPMPSEPVTHDGDAASSGADTGADADADSDGGAGAASSLDLPAEPVIAHPPAASERAAAWSDAGPGPSTPAPGDIAVGPSSPAPSLDEPWVAEVWIDPDWYSDQGSSDRMPSPGLPTVVLLRHTSSLIGRTSRSRGIVPEVDISGDPGVSRRHAQLTTDGARWFIEDLGSANGTYVGATARGLPGDPIQSGQKREIASGEQVYVGAWTRIVIRKAADGEF